MLFQPANSSTHVHVCTIQLTPGGESHSVCLREQTLPSSPPLSWARSARKPARHSHGRDVTDIHGEVRVVRAERKIRCVRFPSELMQHTSVKL